MNPIEILFLFAILLASLPIDVDSSRLAQELGVETQIEYYDNGKKRTSRIYAPSGRKSIFTEWHENGEIKEETHNGHDGYYRATWHENGNEKSVEQSHNGKRIGKWTNWYENGQKESEIDYDNYFRTQWYENGLTGFEEVCINYRSPCKLTSWYENGQMQSDGQLFSRNEIYSDDWYESFGTLKKVGRWDFWRENGQLMDASYYLNGEISKMVLFDENGQLTAEHYFLNGEISKMVLFDGNGHKGSEYYYLNGEISKSIYWLSDGTIFHSNEQTD